MRRLPLGNSTRPVRVLESFPWRRPTTNPYLTQLQQSLDELPDVQVLNFSWRTALMRGYDVFHVHWPEALLDGRSWATRTAHDCFFLLLLLRVRLQGIPLVRTVHNLKRPTGLPFWENFLLSLAERWTVLRIRVNPFTEVPSGKEVVTILHGHYRGWFAPYPDTQPTPGRLAFFGMVRRYKGIDQLIRAFLGIPVTGWATSLIIAGHPSADDLASDLQRLVSNDPRVELDFRFLEDAELAAVAGSAELVVLPYREMHNSGGTLTALSLARPVLVPDNPVNRELAREVGEGWVHTYVGTLTSDRLEAALAELRRRPPVGPPDLSARGWEQAGLDHLAAFRRAMAKPTSSRASTGRGRRRRAAGRSTAGEVPGPGRDGML